jgi:UDP-N-acetylglucosamine transferase subunit ALG13
VLLGSDGAALTLLRKEFPDLPYIELPAYDIRYSKKAVWFSLRLLLKFPKVQRAIAAERTIVKSLVREGKINGILSDNRFGVRHKKIPSVFLTHQLNVLSGRTTYLTSYLHRRIIKKFDECWVPDVEGARNLTGRLGHVKKTSLPIRYIGPLSRMGKCDLPKIYDVLILLSGPEPQRSIFEDLCLATFQDTTKKMLLVRGIVEPNVVYSEKNGVKVVNFMESKALEQAINESELVVSRSGYTTIMDLAALEKKAFFVPTPGQFEQKYLAKRLRRMGVVPSCSQAKFTANKIDQIPVYQGLKAYSGEPDYDSLFCLFEGK